MRLPTRHAISMMNLASCCGKRGTRKNQLIVGAKRVHIMDLQLARGSPFLSSPFEWRSVWQALALATWYTRLDQVCTLQVPSPKFLSAKSRFQHSTCAHSVSCQISSTSANTPKIEVGLNDTQIRHSHICTLTGGKDQLHGNKHTRIFTLLLLEMTAFHDLLKPGCANLDGFGAH